MIGREMEEAHMLDTPDGIVVKSGRVDGEPHLSFYTGRWEPMLDVEEVRELAAVLNGWLAKQAVRVRR